MEWKRGETFVKVAKKQNKKVHEIIEQTKQLMETTFAAN